MVNVLNACPFNLKDGKERILWEITPRCNMNCKHCLFYMGNGKKCSDEITMEQAFEIIDNIKKDKSIKAIWISGGEPLLRKDIVEICKYIKEAGIKPSISTNGVLLTEELIEKLYNAGVEYMHLSIDGATAQTHNNLRGVPQAFGILMDKMELLKTSPINVGASFMVTEKSIDEIDGVLEIAKSKNLNVISFYLVAELGRGAINFKKEKFDLAKKLYEKINSIDRNRYPGLKIEMFRANRSNLDDNDIIQECKGYNFFNITYDGNLGGCPWLMKSEHAFTVREFIK